MKENLEPSEAKEDLAMEYDLGITGLVVLTSAGNLGVVV